MTDGVQRAGGARSPSRAPDRRFVDKADVHKERHRPEGDPEQDHFATVGFGLGLVGWELAQPDSPKARTRFKRLSNRPGGPVKPIIGQRLAGATAESDARMKMVNKPLAKQGFTFTCKRRSASLPTEHA